MHELLVGILIHIAEHVLKRWHWLAARRCRFIRRVRLAILRYHRPKRVRPFGLKPPVIIEVKTFWSARQKVRRKRKKV